MAILRALWTEKLIFSRKTLRCSIDLTPKHIAIQYEPDTALRPNPSYSLNIRVHQKFKKFSDHFILDVATLFVLRIQLLAKSDPPTEVRPKLGEIKN